MGWGPSLAFLQVFVYKELQNYLGCHSGTLNHPSITLSHCHLFAGPQEQKYLRVIALGSEAWNPVSDVVSTLHQAMLEGHWLVLDNCHLMSHWPRELLQPLLGLLDGAKGECAA